MTWSDKTNEALRAWLRPRTWDTDSADDRSRFFVFVASVWNDEHRLWDEAEACEIIANEAEKLHPDSGDRARTVAKKRVFEGTRILDFLWLLRKKGRFELLSR